MSLLGKGRQEKVGPIEALTPSEKEVLVALFEWDYQQHRANSFSIAIKLNMAQSTVGKALQYLAYRGLAGKSQGRSWFLFPNIKEMLTVALDHTDSAQVSEPAFSDNQTG